MHTERLLKLAEHLESGKLIHKTFNFDKFNGGEGEVDASIKAAYPGCGTVGCALGECPGAFPGEWVFGEFGLPVLKGKIDHAPLSSAAEFFEVSDLSGATSHLFWPNAQRPNVFGGKECGADASPADVAANIREFVSRAS